MISMHPKLEAYVPLALHTAKDRGSARADLSHACLGLISETGELTSIIKRVVVYGREMTPEMRGHAAEELGDICWYLALACRSLGVTVSDSFGQLKDFSDPRLHPDSLEEATKVVACAAVALVAWHMSPESVCEEVDDAMAIPALTFSALEHMSGLLGLDFGEILDNNIAKLKLRYPAAYSDEAAELRADKGGLDARNS